MIEMYNLYRDAFSAYRRHRLQVVILEYLATDGLLNSSPVSLLEIAPHIDKSLMWNSNFIDIQRAVLYLWKLEYIDYNKDSEIVKITQNGICALKDGSIQNLAYSAFRGVVSIRLQFLCIAVSMIALLISILK